MYRRHLYFIVPHFHTVFWVPKLRNDQLTQEQMKHNDEEAYTDPEKGR